MKCPVYDTRYNLQYWNGNKLVETVMYNVPKPLAMWKAKQLKQTSHILGTFKYVEVKTTGK